MCCPGCRKYLQQSPTWRQTDHSHGIYSCELSTQSRQVRSVKAWGWAGTSATERYSGGKLNFTKSSIFLGKPIVTMIPQQTFSVQARYSLLVFSGQTLKWPPEQDADFASISHQDYLMFTLQALHHRCKIARRLWSRLSACRAVFTAHYTPDLVAH